MLGIRFIKIDPTTYLLQYRGGRAVREGAGLSFFYYAPATSLVAVPVASTDAPFIFEETTADFQGVTLQGQVTYRVADPKRLAGLMNFTLDARGTGYVSEDPQKLPQRVINVVNVLARAELQALRLREAIYARRNSAVEQERAIKENELNTEVAVENKKREIREAQMDAERAVQEKQTQLRQAEMTANIDLEEKRKGLVALAADNAKAEADARAYGISTAMKAISTADAATLQALASVGMKPDQLIAVAFQELAGRADKIGQLNISPELLRELLAKK